MVCSNTLPFTWYVCYFSKTYYIAFAKFDGNGNFVLYLPRGDNVQFDAKSDAIIEFTLFLRSPCFQHPLFNGWDKLRFLLILRQPTRRFPKRRPIIVPELQTELYNSQVWTPLFPDLLNEAVSFLVQADFSSWALRVRRKAMHIIQARTPINELNPIINVNIFFQNGHRRDYAASS